MGIQLTSRLQPSNHHRMLFPASSRSRCLTAMVELSSEKWPASCFCRVSFSVGWVNFRRAGAVFGGRPAFSGFLYAPQNAERSLRVPPPIASSHRRAFGIDRYRLPALLSCRPARCTGRNPPLSIYYLCMEMIRRCQIPEMAPMASPDRRGEKGSGRAGGGAGRTIWSECPPSMLGAIYWRARRPTRMAARTMTCRRRRRRRRWRVGVEDWRRRRGGGWGRR